MMRKIGFNVLLGVILLGACTPAPMNAPDAEFANSGILPGSKGILPGSKGILPGSKGILPGSKGILPGSKAGSGILPGTKGERVQLAQLELQVSLPANDFAVQQIKEPEADWVALVDGESVAATRLLKAESLSDERRLSFRLEGLKPLKEGDCQEILIYSGDGVLQAATLVPAAETGKGRLAQALNSESFAAWLIAKEYQRNRGKRLKELTVAEFELLLGLEEAKGLAGRIKALYRSGKLEGDPASDEVLMKETVASSQKLSEKVNQGNGGSVGNDPNPNANPNAAATGSGNNNGSNGNSSSSSNANPNANGNAAGSSDTSSDGNANGSANGNASNSSANGNDSSSNSGASGNSNANGSSSSGNGNANGGTNGNAGGKKK